MAKDSSNTPSSVKLSIFGLAGKKKGLLVLSGIFAVTGTLLSFAPYLGVYGVVREIILQLSGSGGLAVSSLLKIAGAVLIATTAGLLCNLIANLISHKAAFDIVHDLRMAFARHLGKLSMGYHTTTATSNTRKAMNESINKLETFIAHQLPDTISAAAAPLTAIILLFVFDWRLGLACLVGLLAAFGIEIYGMSQPAASKFSALYQQKQAEMSNSALEYIRGISVVKAFGQTIHSFKRFHDTIRENEKMSLDYAFSVRSCYTLFQVLLNSLFLFVLPVGILIGSRTADYQAFALSFIFYLFFSGALSGPVMKLVYVFTQTHAMQYCLQQVSEIFALPQISDEGRITALNDFTITFEDVSFTYVDDSQQNVLEHVNFTAESGQLTALVGPSGSGKTTIAQLIPRFWDVTQGRILIGGTDIRDLSIDTLMKSLSFVFQDVFLFQKSILENIKVGREQATDAEVIAVAKAAMCHEFISALPDGYHTVFGKSGTRLSGGEMQRIVIARAMLKDAPIVILDEATAFADPENEQKIQIALETLMQGKTVIVIAHRLATIRGADKIIVVNQGRIAEQGSHDHLIEHGIKYQEMWKAYSQALSWKLNERGQAS